MELHVTALLYSRQHHCKQFSKHILIKALMLPSALANAYICALNKIINHKRSKDCIVLNFKLLINQNVKLSVACTAIFVKFRISTCSSLSSTST